MTSLFRYVFFCFNVYAKYSVITCGWKIWIFISILSADIQQKFFVPQFFTFYTKFITCRGLMVDSKSNKCNSNYKFMLIFTTENLPISIHGQQAFYHTIKTRIHFRHIESIQLSSRWLIFVAILVPILIPWPYLFTYHCQVSSRLVSSLLQNVAFCPFGIDLNFSNIILIASLRHACIWFVSTCYRIRFFDSMCALNFCLLLEQQIFQFPHIRLFHLSLRLFQFFIHYVDRAEWNWIFCKEHVIRGVTCSVFTHTYTHLNTHAKHFLDADERRQRWWRRHRIENGN